MIERVQFLPWHAEVMDARGERITGEFISLAIAAPSLGPCITLMSDQRPIASMGFVIICGGTAEVWVLAARDIGKFRLSLHRTALWALAESNRRYGIYRFQAAIDRDKIVNRRWAERLGFYVEGPSMARFGPDGETYMRYVKLFD